MQRSLEYSCVSKNDPKIILNDLGKDSNSEKNLPKKKYFTIIEVLTTFKFIY